MSIKKNLIKKYLTNRRKVLVYLAVGISIIAIIGMGHMLCKYLGRISDLKSKEVYVGLQERDLNERYYLQLKEDNTYILMDEYVLGNDFAGQEDPPFIIYSYGTYEKEGETYNLTPERAVEITFADKDSVKKRQVSYYGYVEKEEMYGYWINNDVYQDKKNHYYLCAEENGRRQKWLYLSKRTDLPVTMEEFLAQYTFKKQ